MKALLRCAAGYVIDFFRERVDAGDFRTASITRALVAPGLDERGVAAVHKLFPEAELRIFGPQTDLFHIRRQRFDLVCIPMAGGSVRERLVGLLSGARHKLLLPSPDYVYRLGIRRAWPAVAWAVVDRFLIAPLALVWMGMVGAAMYATGLVARAAAGERGLASWHPDRVLVIQLMPTKTFVRLIERLRRRFPHSHIAVLTAAGEATSEAADAVMRRREAGAGAVLRKLRGGRYDSIVLAGGADYGLSSTYVKAAVLARMCPGAQRYQWEIGEELPGRPLWRAMLAQVPARQVGAPAMIRRGFWRVHYRTEPRRGPKIVQIGITRGCNYHCVFCPFHSRRAERGHKDAELPRMSYMTFARLLGDLKRMGTQMVDICGDGEPLMHPEAMEMIALARGLGFDVTLATNAALLTERRARRLVDLEVRRMHVSVNAARDETYEKLHPGAPRGMLSRITEALRGMADYAEQEGRRPIEVEYSAVLNRLNMHEIPAMVAAAHEARAKWFMLILMGPVEGAEDLIPRPEDWMPIQQDIARAAARARELGVRTNLEAITPGATAAGTRSIYERVPCHIGHEYALVLADGSVMFCCQCSRPLGTVNGDSFARIWYSEAYQQARRQARELPDAREALSGCECFTACSHVAVNLDVYRRLHGDRGLRSVL